MDAEKRIEEIELRRQALVYMGMQLGFQHPAVIALSQELDEFILEEMKVRLEALFSDCSKSTKCR